MEDIPPIEPSTFYGRGVKRPVLESVSQSCIIPYKQSRLLDGPPITWRLFRKQADLLNFTSLHKLQLMGFVFETGSTRLFLAAHPEVFWFHDVQKPSNLRSTYEIIPENTACKLYFDLEFYKDVNPGKDGQKMVNDFISLIIHYLKIKLNVDCSEENILNLDSTTESKFSCHLIFDIPGVCFANNRQAGNFVDFLCEEIRNINEGKIPIPNDLSNISLNDISQLFVFDKKDNNVLFCDQSVYSRNRHFRLYRSTKYGKNAPLVLSPSNKFTTSHFESEYDKELHIFYSSLITYLPGDFEKYKVLNFAGAVGKENKVQSSSNEYVVARSLSDNTPSPLKPIDDLINGIVAPGKIYRSCYFSSTNVINYDIVGNRFCRNIGRPHKSNNVKYIVDLAEGVYYQKCHDFECRFYRSPKVALPPELQLMRTADDSTVEETESAGGNTAPSAADGRRSLQRFPSCGLADEDIIDHLNTSSDFC